MPRALVPPFPDITPPLKVQQESTVNPLYNKCLGSQDVGPYNEMLLYQMLSQ